MSGEELRTRSKPIAIPGTHQFCSPSELVSARRERSLMDCWHLAVSMTVTECQSAAVRGFEPASASFLISPPGARRAATVM
jgi:hypothetical protein